MSGETIRIWCSGKPRDDREQRPVRVRRLRRHVDRRLAGRRVDVGDAPAALERRRVAARVERVERDHLVGLRERAVGGLLVAGLPVVDVIVGLAFLVVADDRRAVGERLLRRGDRRQDLVVDVDQLERVAGDVGALGDDRRDLLALEAHLVGGEHGLRVARERRHPRQVVLRHQLARHDRDDAGQRRRAARVDRLDPGVRDRAPQELHVEHVGQRDVVDVVAAAAEEAAVLEPLHRVSEAARFDCGHYELLLCQRGGRVLHGLHDVLVSGAAADVPRERPADLLLGGARVLGEQRHRGQHHPRRAEAALEPVLLVEPRLDRVELRALGEPLDRGDLAAVRLHREHRARLRRHAVHEDGAGAAARRVASDVGAGEAERLAQEVDEQEPRLDLGERSLPFTDDGQRARCESSRRRWWPRSSPFLAGLGLGDRLAQSTLGVDADDAPLEVGRAAHVVAGLGSLGRQLAPPP